MRTLDIIQDEVKGCVRCELSKTRTNTVFSRGNPDASLCFVGEAPGEDEDLQGFPFVGRSGKLLDKILTEMGVDVQKDIYVCNIIKCRPPHNRRPTEDEIYTCRPYVEEQLEIVHPKVLVLLGNTAVQGLLGIDQGIGKLRGRFYNWYFGGNKTLAMPTYHPSYLLRNNNPESEPHVHFRSDITLALNKLKELS